MHMNRWEIGIELASTSDEKKPIRGRNEERHERAQPNKRVTHVTSKNKVAHPSAQLQSHAHPKVDSGVRDCDPTYYLTKRCNQVLTTLLCYLTSPRFNEAHLLSDVDRGNVAGSCKLSARASVWAFVAGLPSFAQVF